MSELKSHSSEQKLSPEIPESPSLESNDQLDVTIQKAIDYHFSTQYPEGYWVEELESNPTITAEYVFLMHFLGINDPERREKCKNYLLKYQRKDGGWNIYFGAPSEISTTVEAYIALKMTGVPHNAPEMVRARECIFAKGGIRKVRVFTKIFLAMLGQSSWEFVPATPVELILLPNWFYFNIYEMSSWSRGTVVPLSIICTKKPVWPLPSEQSVPEIFTDADKDLSIKVKKSGLNWPNFFLMMDKVIKVLGKCSWKPFRKFALNKAKRWTLDHQEPEGDFSGIQPAMFNSLIALSLLGYELNHPVMVKGLEAVDRFIIDRKDHLVVQACVSPLWDTAIACNALMDSGVSPDHPKLVQAAEWIWKKQVSERGDWKIKNPSTPAGGWSFEFFNQSYPDTDDTAEILMALNRIPVADKEKKNKEFNRAFTWLMSMQSTNGGWGAFDQDNDHELFNQIPFADHGAMLDPPTVDVTGRILWLLGRIQHDPIDAQVQRAIQFIRKEQEEDGCWFGRWGVNYIYGTWLVLSGLNSIGEDMSQSYICKAVDWLKKHQNSDGGWGETCESYSDPTLRGQGTSTNSQTAWAVMALTEASEGSSSNAKKGIDYLIQNQKQNGSWYEDEFTGTGFPGHFYIKYHMYQQFFPLMALARFKHFQDQKLVPARQAS